MESFAVFKEVVQFSASLLSAVVAGVALSYWKNWWAEKKKQEEWKRGIEDGHGQIKNRLEGQERRLNENEKELLQTNQEVTKHERRLNAHGKKFVRLETVVETLIGKKPRVISEDDDSSDRLDVG